MTKPPHTTSVEETLDAKVERFREKKRSRVAAWKDRLALRVMNQIPEQQHDDVIDAMLEIAIETKIQNLGGDVAADIVGLVTQRLIRTARGKLN